MQAEESALFYRTQERRSSEWRGWVCADYAERQKRIPTLFVFCIHESAFSPKAIWIPLHLAHPPKAPPAHKWECQGIAKACGKAKLFSRNFRTSKTIAYRLLLSHVSERKPFLTVQFPFVFGKIPASFCMEIDGFTREKGVSYTLRGNPTPHHAPSPTSENAFIHWMVLCVV